MCSALSRSIFTAGRLFYRSSHAYTCKVLEYSRVISRRSYTSDDPCKRNLCDESEKEAKLPAGVKSDYNVFREEDAPIILDVEEEKRRLDLEALNAMQELYDPYEGLNMKRGIDGVFDIEDLVELLRKDRAQNIFVATVPEQLTYVNYIVIVTGRSTKHMIALASFVRKAYKLKRNKDDLLPKIEGANSKDWVALDLGNIALHIFSKAARELYDLEVLWAIGPKYDRELNKVECEADFENRYMKFLEQMEPVGDTDSELSKAIDPHDMPAAKSVNSFKPIRHLPQPHLTSNKVI